jgi:hypothetical protein
MRESPMLEKSHQLDVEAFISGLRREYPQLSIRIRELIHTVKCDCNGVTLRLHFPAIAQGRATVWELITAISDYITPFAVDRQRMKDLASQYGKVPPEQYRVECERLQREAIDVFIKAQKKANKSGEAGELLLFILTEWILKAPQLLAKLPLKTSRDVPVHGTDGIHVGYWPEKRALCTYWGEAKLHADVSQAIASAAKSIQNAIKPKKAEYELKLVARHIDTTGFSSEQRSLLLGFLNPLESENYNMRIDITTCLIGFDFDAYRKLNLDSDERQFADLAKAKLQELAPRISKVLTSAGLENRYVELFLFPVPSVQDFRDQFQAKIGWQNDSGTR